MALGYQQDRYYAALKSGITSFHNLKRSVNYKTVSFPALFSFRGEQDFNPSRPGFLFYLLGPGEGLILTPSSEKGIDSTS